jgi:hypothetical protein
MQAAGGSEHPPLRCQKKKSKFGGTVLLTDDIFVQIYCMIVIDNLKVVPRNHAVLSKSESLLKVIWHLVPH